MTEPLSDERFAELCDLSVDSCGGEAPYNPDVWTLEKARQELVAEVERLRAKLDAPCGSCHPCTNYADETWRAAGRTPPHVVEWDELRTERNKAVATVAEQAQRLATREREHNADRAELERLKEQRAALIALHNWDELIFGGFICTHCTPDDCDDPDDNVMWPCPSLRAVGVTDDEAIALIKARRAEIEKAARERAEAKAVTGD